MTDWDRVQELQVRLDGANERIGLVFDAKNMWADRARTAEAMLRLVAADLKNTEMDVGDPDDWIFSLRLRVTP